MYIVFENIIHAFEFPAGPALPGLFFGDEIWRKVSPGHRAGTHTFMCANSGASLDSVEIMPMEHRNVLPWTAGQGVMRHGRRIKAGFVEHRPTSSIISYSILVA